MRLRRIPIALAAAATLAAQSTFTIRMPVRNGDTHLIVAALIGAARVSERLVRGVESAGRPRRPASGGPF